MVSLPQLTISKARKLLSKKEISSTELTKSFIEKIEKNWPKALEGINRNYVHLISPVFNKVCLNKNILDAVESIIGKNILICGTTLFIKNPKEKGFVSFHQDAKIYRLRTSQLGYSLGGNY